MSSKLYGREGAINTESENICSTLPIVPGFKTPLTQTIFITLMNQASNRERYNTIFSSLFDSK
jgi:hypothetical protein